MALPVRVDRQRYTMRDTCLYALGVGAGIGATEPGSRTSALDLSCVYEAELRVLATMAVVLATPGFWLKEPDHGADWPRILHGEQMLQLHRQLAPAAFVRSELRIDQIYDKGPGKGAVLYSSRRVFDENTGELIATVGQSSFLRGDGGCGGPSAGAPKRPTMPETPPDHVIDLPTRPEQALIYRLMGDYNPLHADPKIGRAAGFDGPILHGLATYGVVGRALLHAAVERGCGDLTRMDVRFSSPVYPGETIRTELWWRSGDEALFRARVLERDAVVLDGGLAEFARS